MPAARRERGTPARDFDDLGDERRARVVDDFRVRVRDRVDLGFAERPFVDREVLEDFFARDRVDLVSPFSRRILLTVRAATSSARPPYRPDFFALCLMCLYCRSRFGLAPRGIDFLPSWQC